MRGGSQLLLEPWDTCGVGCTLPRSDVTPLPYSLGALRAPDRVIGCWYPGPAAGSPPGMCWGPSTPAEPCVQGGVCGDTVRSRADTLDPMSVPAAVWRGRSATHRLQAKHPPSPSSAGHPSPPQGRIRHPQGRVGDGDAAIPWAMLEGRWGKPAPALPKLSYPEYVTLGHGPC